MALESCFEATNSSCCCYFSCNFRVWVLILIVDLLQKSVPHTQFHQDLKEMMVKREIQGKKERMAKWDAGGQKELKESWVIWEPRAILASLAPLARRVTKEERVRLGFLEKKARQVPSVTVEGTGKWLDNWISVSLGLRHL